jgi:hypothetical protein
MSNFWYYAESDVTRGPVTLDELIKILSLAPNAKGILVWREGFGDWQTADSVREIVEWLFRPPPLGPKSSTMTRLNTSVPPPLPDITVHPTDIAARHQQALEKIEPQPPAARGADMRGRIAFLIVLAMVITLVAYLANRFYGGSGNGTAYLVGELIGPWIVFTAITWKWRRSTYTAAAVLAISALAVVLSNFNKLQSRFDVEESKAALQGIASPTEIDAAVKQHPSNKFLQMMSSANKAATDTNVAIEELSDEIEPPALSKNVELVTANRKELEALRADLKTAEANTLAFMSRYKSLLKAERDKIESFALSIHFEKGLVASFLSGVDKRHATSTDYTSKVIMARFDFYRAYQNYVVVLLEEYGSYNAVDGKFSFKLQRTADRFNAAATAMDAAAARMNELETERKKMAQLQQDKWDEFVKRK